MHRPEFERLVDELRTHQQQQTRKAQWREHAAAVMQKALDLCRDGRLSAQAISQLQATRIRIEESF